MKRYLAFAHDDYYPSGGMGDLIGNYDTLEEAYDALGKLAPYDIKEVCDQDTYEMLDYYSRDSIKEIE